MTQKQRIIFCDFDGTITVNDNIVAIMKHFQPEGWETLVKQVLSKEITIRDGVGRMFALLPTSRKDEVIDYAIRNVKLRDGFRELLDYCRKEQVTFLVTSGGIDFFVYPVLEPFDIDKDRIYCNGSDFSGASIRIVWPHACDEHCHNDCGMCKTTIIRRYPREQYERILIGDSVTDFEGAKLADLVFARAQLIELCEELGLNYKPFESFHEVIQGLEETR
ncbi:2-hydroxy-3-keto-5-methylthiopentenyl-1-phosphate phosphatase [Paenibacillus sp. YYML68]|uniref:2-hydroxy-3-keto-5-methylthiopentenyl-1- phosphate phosphatase n=1 Tax=Paenibacillus sp. YYML68 TaxID=2909250 RepID=UPI00248F6335|nr:2-hydroxy-3-keto-5-methylthiopentenyl-1-phosphate phosphatase [Paenibacillus sp. YYML68]